MLDFRKVLLAAAVAGLGLVSSANAQWSYSATTVTEALIHAEGVTEQLPSVTYGTPGTGVAVTTSPSFIVSTNGAPITNVVLTGSTTSQTDAYADVLIAAAHTYYPGVLLNSTTLQFNLGTSTVVTAGAPTSITIDNVRVDVHNLAIGTIVTLTPSAVLNGGVAFTGGGAAAASAGLTVKSLGTTKFTGYSPITTCTLTATDITPVGVVQINGAYANEFATDAAAAAAETYNPTTFLPAPTGVTANPNLTGSIGTRLQVVLGNLNSNVTYYLPITVTNNGLIIKQVTGPTSATVVTATTIPATATGANKPTGAVAALVQTSGTSTVYYEVTAVNGGAADLTAAWAAAVDTGAAGFSTLTLFENVATPTSITTSTGSPTVTVTVTGSVAPSYNQFSSPVQTTVTAAAITGQAASGTGAVNVCSTILLFPYLLTYGGYDTGIAIANTGLGTNTITGNTFTATTSGSCSLSLWGSATANGTTQVSSSIPAIVLPVNSGQVYAIQLGLSLPAATPTFVGYGVATCNFIGAHAYAQVSAGLGGGSSFDYLAPVLSDVFNATSSAVDQVF
jgi:hypothetical protein